MTLKNKLTRRQWSYERPIAEQTMAKGSPAVASVLILMMLASTCLVASTQAQSSAIEDIEILHTAVNPDNNKTYHLLTASSWDCLLYTSPSPRDRG